MKEPKKEVTLSNLSEHEKDFRELAKSSSLMTDEEFNSRKIAPTDIALKDAIKMSQLMCRAKSMLPAHLHGNPGECLAMILLARDWKMNPYTVGQHSYIPSGSNRIGFDGQLVNAAINNSNRLVKPLRYEYTGEGQDRKCTAYGLLYYYDMEDLKLRKEDAEREVTVTMPQNITKQGARGSYTVDKANSTLWDSDPDQQLAYKAARWWCRKYIPEVLFGVYTPQEISEAAQAHKPERNATSDLTKNITTIIAKHNGEDGAFEDIAENIADAEEVVASDDDESTDKNYLYDQNETESPQADLLDDEPEDCQGCNGKGSVSTAEGIEPCQECNGEGRA